MSASEDFTRDVAEHGIRFDLNPTTSSDHFVPVPEGYLEGVEKALRARAQRALRDDAPVPPPADMDLRLHSRACGFRDHQHGVECHDNCPTCGGVEDHRENTHSHSWQLQSAGNSQYWLCTTCTVTISKMKS